jgi:hypothetical protein
MKRYLALLAVSLGLTMVSVMKAISSSAFSLWDVAYYLGALGTVFSMGKLLRDLP